MDEKRAQSRCAATSEASEASGDVQISCLSNDNIFHECNTNSTYNIKYNHIVYLVFSCRQTL